MIGENIFAWSTSVLLNMYTVSPQISTQNFLDSKTYNWPLVKTTVNHRHQPRCHHSQLYLGRFKESYNEGIKVQVRRTIKNHSFLSRKKGHRLCLNFPEPRVLVHSRCLKPHFRINVSFFCCPLFFNPQVRIKKMANVVTYYLSPLGLT